VKNYCLSLLYITVMAHVTVSEYGETLTTTQVVVINITGASSVIMS